MERCRWLIDPRWSRAFAENVVPRKLPGYRVLRSLHADVEEFTTNREVREPGPAAAGTQRPAWATRPSL